MAWTSMSWTPQREKTTQNNKSTNNRSFDKLKYCRKRWACERWENHTEIGQIALKKRSDLALLGGFTSSVVPSGASPSHLKQIWGRSRNYLRAKLSSANCSVLGVLVLSPGTEGIMSQATCVAHGCCWIQIALIKWSIPLQTCLLQSPLLYR